MAKEQEWVKKNGFILTNPSIAVTTRTFSVLLEVDQESKTRIYHAIQKAIPDQLRKKVFFQPFESYHITLQSTTDTVTDINGLTIALQQALEGHSRIAGPVVLPFASDNSFLGIPLIDSEWMKQMRQDSASVFHSYHLTPKITPRNKEHFEQWSELGWVSLVRILEPFTEDEIELGRSLPSCVIDGVWYPSVVIADTDPFFSPVHSEIYGMVQYSVGQSSEG